MSALDPRAPRAAGPPTRSLAAVLRRQLDDARHGARILIGEVVDVPDDARVTLMFEDGPRTVPRLSGYVPTLGAAAYCLADETLVLVLGEVAAPTPLAEAATLAVEA